ncbi:MAG: M23 family metallopeptidase [Kofleriaceae bacterium]
MKATLLVTAAIALPASAIASPAQVGPQLAVELAPRLALQLLDELDSLIAPRAAIEHVVRWQREARDLIRDANARLAELAAQAGLGVPDIRVLTHQPIAHGESSGFGWRDDPIRHRPKFHSGTDFRGKHGTPVLAAGDGVVVFTGRQGGYGNMVEVDHGGGVITRYAHLRRIETRRDAAVTAGQQIGQVGSTGRTTGPHLHFEVRLDRRPVDPVMAMAIAELARESEPAGRIASFALAPELQQAARSHIDPPRTRIARSKKSGKARPHESRPDRPGRIRHAKPVS